MYESIPEVGKPGTRPPGIHGPGIHPVYAGGFSRSPGSRVDLLLLTVVLIWGMNFAVMKGLYAYFNPLAFTSLRFIIAVVTLLLILKLRRIPLRIDRSDLPMIAGLGVAANTLYQILFVSGLAQTKAGNAALITSAAPIFAYLTGVFLRREIYTHRVLSGILVSFAGVGLIVLFGSSDVALGAHWQGDAMILASALCWGWYTGAATGMVLKYGALRLTLWVMLTGTAVMIPLLLPQILHQDWRAVPALGWLGFGYSTFLSIVYSYLIWSFALQHVGVSRTAVFSYLTPIIALFGGWLLLGEAPVVPQFAGIGLIFGGVLLVKSNRSPWHLEALRSRRARASGKASGR